MSASGTSPSPTLRRTPNVERVLETYDLSVSYGTFTAADRITIAVSPGEIYGLLGPNGAGKTSVIRALTTILPVSAGSARVAGHPLSDSMAIRSNIGVLPESNGYPSSQTARSYLRFHGQLFGLSKPDATARAEVLLGQLGLSRNKNRISTFSRGMRQRLGLARALINRPAVLFLDEPTLGLDPAGKADIMDHLVRIALGDRTCVILCSHLLDEVERICDRVAIMDHGRIVAEGTVDEVIAASGISGKGRIRVSAPEIAQANTTLRSTPAVTEIRFDNARPGDIAIELAPYDGAGSDLLGSLLEAGIVPRSFDLEGARLSDAFLAITDPSSSRPRWGETR